MEVALLNDPERVDLLVKISSIFDDFGIKSTSMDDLSNLLKMSKKTLYKWFKNKSDVVEQVLLYRHNELYKIDEMKDSFLLKEDLLQRFYESVIRMCNSLKTKKRANYFDVKKYYPEIYDKYVRQFDSYLYHFFLKFINTGISRGLFKDFNDYPLRVFLLFQLYSTFGNPEYQVEQNYDSCQMVFCTFDIFIRSILTTEGMVQWEQIQRDNSVNELFPEKTDN